MNAHPRAADLYLYLEDGLNPYEARKIEEHVEACTRCREALEERRILHEAFTTLPPFEVPEGFARSVLAALPEPEPARGGWKALLAGLSALTLALLGFHFFTGHGLSDLLVSLNRFAGSCAAVCLPAAVKLLKIAGLLLKVGADLAGLAVDGAGAMARSLGPQGLAAAAGLAGLLAALAWFGARRYHSAGERS
jgi:anti-sigma factor RsiW